ncbi:bifunctional methylenetetrahydrofolate dehydrogenase/methenyltetrahydrofolate cyclohydrolase FolD [Rhodoblastus acidophilus]|uniref:Bifunctional protein FolD n=1 Tax=Candidatus Rhodoblastus alkanivorans TaxID=2954117 RepID=A0ABS9Z3U3_9HYPH|nr:bifunctional methylenetetrahydrofolate dehydrogenase/methenyltetrahydrofolate cyclohydrolase FolD [Candidatus Rhodoblastus alkanivorans]MCI4679024.1 bifunctional methylenetetrahydrofolate dehydrogenase/methenyltetrahydrofolate cyclohydrolase FolD [Candidatus Rhodoblastus alkanivorans]MCI4681721.1 bifunctional methylenetetrahydrofolate dehydrogenase/methenyltetrahydrofolate cyclohydrolase FolD [Candidatus Rhodoblastus alkanivorans]MDI4642770.1 bifunctional methylenetetrahydrofolate dehydrogena
MSARIIDGKAFAESLRAKISSRVASLVARTGRAPGLAVVLVGDDPASQIYVRSKAKQTVEVGMRSTEVRLPAETNQQDLLAVIEVMNADDGIDGILVQLPLPEHIDEAAALAAISPEKDVDGFHVVNAGLLATGGKGVVPCTPSGAMMLIEDEQRDLSGLEAVVVGRSNLVGKPMAQLLLKANCTVTVAHSRSRELPGLCRRADILVTAVGCPEMIRGDWIKPGAIAIDVGINRVPAPERGEGKTRLVGDIAFSEAVQVAGSITPVPGGVGPMTIACLLHNVLRIAESKA